MRRIACWRPSFACASQGDAQGGDVVLWECYGLQRTNAYLARLLEVSALVCRLILMERAAASYHGCPCSLTDEAPRPLRRTETAGALPPFATLLAIRPHRNST